MIVKILMTCLQKYSAQQSLVNEGFHVSALSWIYIYLRRSTQMELLKLFQGAFYVLNATLSFQWLTGKCTPSSAPFVWQLRNVFQSSFILSVRPNAHGAACPWQPACGERILLLRLINDLKPISGWLFGGFSSAAVTLETPATLSFSSDNHTVLINLDFSW